MTSGAPPRERAEVLERIDALHSMLARMVLEGAGLDSMAAEVTRVLDVGIVITSVDGREQGASVTGEQRVLLADADLVDHTGRVRVERLRTQEDPSGAPLGDGEVRLVKVAAAGADLVRLICVSADRLIAPDDLQALERAATVVALLVTQQRAVAAVENKYRGDFLRDVLHGETEDHALVIEHARGLGWDLDRPSVVLVAQLDPPTPQEGPVPPELRREWHERFAQAWCLVCQARDRSIPTADFSTEVVALVPIPVHESEQEQQRLMRAEVAHLVGEVAGDRGGGRRPFSAGVSRPVDAIAGLPTAYHQARRATSVGRRITGGGYATWFDELGLHRLIALVPDDAELQRFADDVLGELAGDTPEAGELRTTLQVLLDSNFNVAEAARMQFFHYNTMRYRVGKLERLLGPFTTDPHLRLNVAVALQVLDFRG